LIDQGGGAVRLAEAGLIGGFERRGGRLTVGGIDQPVSGIERSARGGAGKSGVVVVVDEGVRRSMVEGDEV